MLTGALSAPVAPQGLGKTVQAIAVMSTYRDEWPVLVICPSSLRGMAEHGTMLWASCPLPFAQSLLFCCLA